MKNVAKHPCSAQTGWSLTDAACERPPLLCRGCCSTRHTVARHSFWTVGAVYEGVNELVGIGVIPLLREEGWTRH